MTLKLILAFVIAFAVSAVVGFFLVPYLKRIKAGQSIKENGPTWHMSKQGTPTMGGLMFIAAIAVVCLSVGFDCMAEGEYGHLFCLAFALVFGAIGFLDDYEKLKKKQNLGLTAGKKILLQLAAAVAFIFLMRRFGYVALDSLYIPFWNTTVAISEPLRRLRHRRHGQLREPHRRRGRSRREHDDAGVHLFCRAVHSLGRAVFVPRRVRLRHRRRPAGLFDL